jgi:XTP/dITP diphosphohydrolase
MTSELERAVEVMDQLRSPGGCPWDAEQTHRSLARYLLEETYEVLEAIETDDLTLLREELGDLLLQVLFHARLAQEAAQPFTIEDVAADLTDKLIRRHPHVFAGAAVSDSATLNETWEQQKVAEKGRTSALDGVPLAQPSLALAAKLVARARRSQLDIPLGSSLSANEGARAEADEEFGARLLGLVGEAVAAGVDPEGALRRATLGYRDAILAAEQARSTP